MEFCARLKNKLFTPFLKRKYGFYKHSFSNAPVVIMFHRVVNSIPDAAFTAELNSFKEFILYIKKTIGFIKPTDLFSSNRGVLLTFDDGTTDLLANAYPFLKKESIPFLFFVITDRIGKDGYLNEAQIKQLDNDPLVFVGAHSKTHPKLRFASNAREEICGSIDSLNMLCNHQIDYFAYPYGSVYACSKSNINDAKNSGVKYAFSTIPGYIGKGARKNLFYIPRFNGDFLMKKYFVKEWSVEKVFK